MERENSRHQDDHTEREPADRLEQVLDEALRVVAAPAPVDLRARVIAAIGRDEALAAPSWGPVAAWRPAVALATVIFLAAATLVVFGPGKQAARDDAPAKTATAALANQEARGAHPGEPGGSREPRGSDSREPGGSRHAESAAPATAADGAPGTAAASRASGGGRTAAGRAWLQRLRQPTPGAEAAIVADAALAAIAEPYMPGAAAGDLGDPLRPLPVPPPIRIDPITQPAIEAGATISEVARPVTEFTTEDTPPGARSRDTGRSGGSSR